MPTYPVNSSPMQVSKQLTDSCWVQNVGTKTIYLSQYTTVSQGNSDAVLTPGSSFTWPGGIDLWAATAVGETSSLATLYNGQGAAAGSVVANIEGPITAEISGPVDATITGPVTVNAGSTFPVAGTVAIGAPVNVQGGGALLKTQSGSGASTGLYPLQGASANTYPGLRIACSNAGTSASFFPVNFQLLNTDTGEVYADTTLINLGYNPANSFFLGDWSNHVFTVPTPDAYQNLAIQVRPLSTSSSWAFSVRGVATSPSAPTTDLSSSFNTNGNPFVGSIPFGTNNTLYLPASFNPYRVEVFLGPGYVGANGPFLNLEDVSPRNLLTWNAVRAQPLKNTVSGSGGGSFTAQVPYSFLTNGGGNSLRLGAASGWTAGNVNANLSMA